LSYGYATSVARLDGYDNARASGTGPAPLASAWNADTLSELPTVGQRRGADRTGFSRSVVFFGQHGDVSHHAAQQGVSRQRLDRQAEGVLRDLDPLPSQQQVARLQQPVADLRRRLEELQAQQPFRALIDPDQQAEFASVAQAEGVSLPLARRLLALFLRERTPSVAQLGRWAKAAGRRASATLAVLDEFSRPLVRDAALDELFAGRKPLLMAVELASLALAAGQLSDSRDGEAWAELLRKLPALHFVSRDAGTGLDAGIRRKDTAS
jgi:hypothetical protein